MITKEDLPIYKSGPSEQELTESFRSFVECFETPWVLTNNVSEECVDIGHWIAHLAELLGRPGPTSLILVDPSVGVRHTCLQIVHRTLRVGSSTTEMSWHQLKERLLVLSEQKSHDYECEIVNFGTYWPDGAKDLWVMVHNKWLRLLSLTWSGKIPNFESIADNCIDLCAYTCWLKVLYDYENPNGKA